MPLSAYVSFLRLRKVINAHRISFLKLTEEHHNYHSLFLQVGVEQSNSQNQQEIEN